jgi:hypothetical protein
MDAENQAPPMNRWQRMMAWLTSWTGACLDPQPKLSLWLLCGNATHHIGCVEAASLALVE